MSDNSVEVRIGGDASEAQNAMSAAANAIKSSVSEMTGSLGGLGAAFEAVKAPFLMLSAVLAGGKIFKESIDSVVEEAGEVKKLSNAFGMTAEKANELNIALRLVGISAEEYVGIAMKFDRQLKTNESGLNTLGVATRDSNGSLLDQQTLLKNAVSTMMEYKAGTDRNQFALTNFGRSAEEAFKLLKLNNDVQERATEMAKKYGIGIGQDAVEAVKKYKIEHAAAGIVMEEFSQKLGEALIPAITKMNTAFVEIGSAILPVVSQAFEVLGELIGAVGEVISGAAGVIVEVFNQVGETAKEIFGDSVPKDMSIMNMAVGTLSSLITAAKFAILEFFQVIGMGVARASIAWRTFAEIASAAIRLDFAGAKAAYEKGMNEMTAASQAHANKMVEIYQAADNKIKAIWGGEQSEGKEDSPKSGTKSFVSPDKTKGDSQIQTWKADLEQKKEDEGNFFKSSLQMEEQFWTAKLAAVTGNSVKEVKLRREIQHELFSIHKQQATDERATEDEKLLAKQKMAKIELDGEREKLRLKKEMGDLSDSEYLQAMSILMDKEYNIQLKALQDKLALYEEDKKAQQKINTDIEILTAEHANNVKKINDDVMLSKKKEYEQMMSPVTSAIDKSITGMIQGTITMQKALHNIFQSILGEFVSMATKMVTQWIAGEIVKTEASQTNALVRGAISEQESAASLSSQVGNILKSISNSAQEAFAGIFGFLAPEMGPAAAGPAAAGSAVVMGLGANLMAEKGFDIPAGMNPITQLHQKEMVLPAEQADVIRGMASSGSPTIKLNAVPMKGGFLMMHKNELAKVIKDLHRNGSLKLS
ncbi:hypothetical protein [Polynucleobacter sp. AP-RePozz3-80-G7]|uniref:hypothetical protein n=1 Tax=Polynucleobacter sp. AP-RePozz3-80-G7 TaxID=2689105 RepID=UPI001C0CFFB7|nr:hypothetical protein [Polynucleobacter sp. AP-RePozz3-80-G7]MBU3640018.1 hypothetical protein [Polynucleobacter sp. AP-RePozz3-80-G7]